jgi:hypothetical protein
MSSIATEILENTKDESSQINPLKEQFDQVWVINLKRRPERLARFRNEIENANWPFIQPSVFPAIEGDKVGVPNFWQTGGGSYGCLRSHLILLERAILDDVRSILVLEDDALFTKTFAMDVARFFSNVPKDWQCLMLGGQHTNSQPEPISPGVVRAGKGGGIQRTHCYALRGQEVMKALYRVWADSAVHCDWVMGPCMANFNTYAPDPFLVGQADGHSDISGAQNPTKFWRPPNGNEPIIVLHTPREAMEALRQKGWHTGYNRNPGTGIDLGLNDLMSDTSLSPRDRNEKLRGWIRMIQWEVVSMVDRGICTIWHPEIHAELIRPLVGGKVIEIIANTSDEALAQLPDDIFEHSKQPIRVVVLRASREVMEALRERGWHSGYWRDEITGRDNGLRQLFDATSDKYKRSVGLRNIVRILHEEARLLPNGIVALWYDGIESDMLDSDEMTSIVIEADSPEDAVSQLKKFDSHQ